MSKSYKKKKEEIRTLARLGRESLEEMTERGYLAKLAEAKREYFNSLVESGFSKDEAMEIVKDTDIDPFWQEVR